MRWPRRGLLGAFLLVVAMPGGSVWVLLTHPVGPHTARNYLALGTVSAAITLLGLLIAFRVRGNLVGPLLAWAGACAMFLAARDVYYAVAVADPDGLPLDSRVVAALDESGWWL